jgi:deoxyribodipyrimidine photolyase-related protein
MEAGKPIGGKLTYDTENRKRPYNGIEEDIPEEKNYDGNKYIKDAYNYIKKNISSNDLFIWENDIDKLELKFPIDTKGAKKQLEHFIKYKFDMFGDYQDVFLKDSDNSFIFHSGISPMLNIGLITPIEVIDKIIQVYNLSKNKKNILNNVEGFIRQILGWREFCRFTYKLHSDKYLNKNYFKSTKSLDETWYNGTTNILPVDHCIEKAFRFGYLHHIERLMVMANYMTITNINPKDMYKWFMEFSLDSYDWVMEYNIYCMGSYADGGHFTTKPYISSTNYIFKMSNYKKQESEDWINIWDMSFWKFIDKNKQKIAKIGRMSQLIKYAKNAITKINNS